MRTTTKTRTISTSRSTNIKVGISIKRIVGGADGTAGARAPAAY
jgi:hypothetical protein